MKKNKQNETEKYIEDFEKRFDAQEATPEMERESEGELKSLNDRQNTPEYKAYLKARNILLKRLINDAKGFHDFDYGYLVTLTLDAINLYLNLHKNKTAVTYEWDEVKDGEEECIGEKITKSLETVAELLTASQQSVSGYEEKDILKEAFHIIGDNIYLWWD